MKKTTSKSIQLMVKGLGIALFLLLLTVQWNGASAQSETFKKYRVYKGKHQTEVVIDADSEQQNPEKVVAILRGTKEYLQVIHKEGNVFRLESRNAIEVLKLRHLLESYGYHLSPNCILRK